MEIKYEYLDHTADIQVHSWGDTLEEAFIQAGNGMLNYMYEQESVCNEDVSREIIIEGVSTVNRLLYTFLEELLYIFSSDPFLAVKSIKIVETIQLNPQTGKYSIKAICGGEEYQRARHGSKTEIKAVTFSNLRIENILGIHHLHVIFDI